jgi:hypothetical protein
MSSVLTKAISNSTPLGIQIQRLDSTHALAAVTLADKIEISHIRVKLKHGAARVFWPATPDHDLANRPRRGCSRSCAFSTTSSAGGSSRRS